MTDHRRRKILIVALFTTVLVIWDTALGPGSGYWELQRARHDPPKLLPIQRPEGAMRVLFIGNSFTRYWGGQVLIGTKMAMSSPGWQDRRPIYEQSTGDGMSLKDHWELRHALERIREGNWDYVVLQDHSEAPLRHAAVFRKYARLFDAEIKKAGAKTVLFMTWAKVGEPMNQPLIATAYGSLAKELGAEVVPVGLAFQEVMAHRSDLRLHEADGKHPTMAGSYLTACCFYTFFYGRSPTGLSRVIYDRGKEWLTIKEGDALYLQDVARRTVKAERSE